MKIKKGDQVKILSGKDRGLIAGVLGVFPREGKVLVEGANLKKKHRKSQRQDRKGEIILLPSPIALSAVALICPSCGKATRVGYHLDAGGTKQRVCKKCGNVL